MSIDYQAGMAQSKRRPPDQESDYDGAWKEALRSHFPLFIGKFFPATFAAIDFRREPQWHDKEISQVLGQSGSRNKSVDVLVKVWSLAGQPQWILLHLEIQAAPEENFERRVSRLNSGLFWTFNERAVTLVILADLDRDWRPHEDVFQLADFESRLKFPTCKLIDKLESEWRHDSSLPVQVARAQIAALKTARDPEGRFKAKWQLVRNLYQAGYNAEEVRELFRLIDWMMHLRADLEQQFRQELLVFEEQLKMPYVTSVERLSRAEGKVEGRAEGKAEGGAEVLIGALSRMSAPLPSDVETAIRSLSFAKLKLLGDELLTLKSLGDLQNWLADHSRD